jgi:hypothetical protein
MQIIEIQTLVDITNTKVIRPNQGTQLQLDQQRNFITLMQCIEIRSIVSYDSRPAFETLDIKDMGFGSAYKGKHTVWTFRITPDREGVYTDDKNDPVGELVNDLNQVPFTKNLLETINIDKAIFDLKDSQYKNTIIKALKGAI